MAERQNTLQKTDTVNGNGTVKNGAAKNGVAVEMPTEITVGEFITVRELAEMMGRSPIDLIKILMQYGIMAPITHNIDHDTAVIIGEELDVEIKWPEPESEEDDEDDSDDAAEQSSSRKSRKTLVDRILDNEKPKNLTERPAVVAVLGHVDHGKTTLLDRIRQANVVDTEAGGITQRTGAYQVVLDDKPITFLDTPGHEAFTAMRARGAQVTDIVVLVVAADDGVMPQTIEAINHAKAAGVQIIVALNKIDRPNANADRVLEELSQHGLQSELWGGETIVVPVSALQGDGIDELLENILIVAELEEYKANPKGATAGTIIEAELDKFRGATANLLVQNGTLRRGDIIVVGTTWGRVKAMFSHDATKLTQAGPSTPVTVLGLQDVPKAGDIFARVRTDKDAKRITAERKSQAETASKSVVRPQMTLDDLFARFEKGEAKVLNLIVRADMQGTLEPVVQSLENLGNDEVQIKVLQAAIGNISESDIMLAEASDAVIIGFSVNSDKSALVRSETSGVEIRYYDIIYKMIEDIEDALAGMLDPIYEEQVIGHADVLQIFKLRRGMIAGCMVSDGMVKRNAEARLLRQGKQVGQGKTKIETLRRFTEDVNEVRTGYECGIRLADNNLQIIEGDVIEIIEQQRVR
ncbi:MAG: translation initiation factor IF-2 [Chloroflexota bacterium]